MTHPILIVTACSLIGGLPTTGPAPSERPERSLAEAESVSCGPRAALVLANRLGYGMKYGQFRDGVELGRWGMSLGALVNLLNSRGVPCRARRLDPSELRHCPPPFIAHMVPRYAMSDGHYLVAIDVGDEGIMTIDPILGHEQFWAWSSFSDGWSGFAAIPEHRLVFIRAWWSIMPGVLVTAILTGAILLKTGRIGRPIPLPRSGVILATFLLIAAPASCAAAQDDQIRAEERDVENAAGLMADIYGRRAFSGEITQSRARSLKELQSLLIARGLPSQIRSLTYPELAMIPGPCVVPLRYGSDNVGNFFILTRFGEDSVTVVKCGPIIVQDMTVDDFRRRWTGHALLPKASDGGRLNAMVGMGWALAPIICLSLYRRRQARVDSTRGEQP